MVKLTENWVYELFLRRREQDAALVKRLNHLIMILLPEVAVVDAVASDVMKPWTR